jgi:hypothetical protein
MEERSSMELRETAIRFSACQVRSLGISMESMAQAKNAKTLSVHLENWIVDELTRRAGMLGWSKSRYAAEILRDWYARGGFPVNDLERVSLVPLRSNTSSELSPLTYVGAQPRAANTAETTGASKKMNTTGAAKKAASSA